MKYISLVFLVRVWDATGQSTISGTINSTNNHWGTGGNVPSPVTIDGLIIVGDNTTLTIQLGTQIFFDSTIAVTAISISGYNSRLIATGTIDNFIYFNGANTRNVSKITTIDSGNMQLNFCKFNNVNLNIYERSDDVQIGNCIFHNTPINIAHTSPLIINNTIYRIDSDFTSRLIHLSRGTFENFSPIIINNILDGSGSGVSCFYEPEPIIKFNMGGVSFPDSSMFIRNCETAENSNFIGMPNFVDPENGDFHLLPTSLAIDAGDPTSDYSLEPGGGGGRINIGAYGNTPEATLKSSVNIDSKPFVAKSDFSIFPNPFNSMTKISWTELNGIVTHIRIYNIEGELLKVFDNPKNGSIYWNASNFTTGIYVAKIRVGQQSLSKRLFLKK